MFMTIEELQKATGHISKEMEKELEKLIKEIENEQEKLSKEMENHGSLNLNEQDVKLIRYLLIIQPGIWNKFSPECKKELLKNRTLLATYIGSLAFSEKEFQSSSPEKIDRNINNLYRVRKLGPYTGEGEAYMLCNLDYSDNDVYKACETMLRTCMLQEIDSRMKNGEDYQTLIHNLPMEHSRMCAMLFEARRYALPGDNSENPEYEKV